MKLTAMMACRNEAWDVGLTLRAALKWNDSAVVLLHACTDETEQIVAQIETENPGRILVITESDPTWKEMTHRQTMLDAARMMGATHATVADADEILCGDLLPTIRGHIERLQPRQFLGIPMKNLHRSIAQYRADDSPFGSRAGTMLAFADAPALGWAARNGYDHHSRAPHGIERPPVMLATEGGLMHLQFASWRRLVAKHRGYRILERLKYPSKPVAEIERMYSLATNETGLKLKPVPASWWQPYEHLMGYLDLDRDPWQEEYVAEMIDQHGLVHFAGLNIA